MQDLFCLFAVKYRLSLAGLKIFFETYVDFLNEVTNSKN